MSAPSASRSGVVLTLGMIVGAGLVELGAFLATAPPAPPIVMVLRPAPAVEPTAAPQVKPPEPVVTAPIAMVKPAPKSLRARRAALAPLPEGMVARLRRPSEGSNLAVSRALIAGANALERGTAYTAWAHFTRALQLDHDNRDALMGVVLCHYELNQKGAADRALTRLLALDPTHPEGSILRGFMAQLKGDASAAIDWYERALPRLEDDAVADELRSVIALLRPQLTLAPTATARAERTR